MDLSTLIGTVGGFAAASALASLVICRFRSLVQVQRDALRRTHYLATHDDLTGLVNRKTLLSNLTHRAACSESYAVLMIDLDGFKAVNDTHGHAAGDAVLVAVAVRLKDLVDGDAIVARLGGDEFVVAAPSPSSVMSAMLADDALRAVLRPVAVGGTDVAVGASVGVVHALPGDPGNDLLHSADMAMYRAKTTGGGVVEYNTGRALVSPTEGRPAARLRDMTDLGRRLAEVA